MLFHTLVKCGLVRNSLFLIFYTTFYFICNFYFCKTNYENLAFFIKPPATKQKRFLGSFLGGLIRYLIYAKNKKILNEKHKKKSILILFIVVVSLDYSTPQNWRHLLKVSIIKKPPLYTWFTLLREWQIILKLIVDILNTLNSCHNKLLKKFCSVIYLTLLE